MKLLEVMEGMDKETFEFKFGKELTFTTVLSDQQVVELIPGGTGIVVGYEDRSRFIQLVQKARLEESREQVLPEARRTESFGQLLVARAQPDRLPVPNPKNSGPHHPLPHIPVYQWGTQIPPVLSKDHVPHYHHE